MNNSVLHHHVNFLFISYTLSYKPSANFAYLLQQHCNCERFHRQQYFTYINEPWPDLYRYRYHVEITMNNKYTNKLTRDPLT